MNKVEGLWKILMIIHILCITIFVSVLIVHRTINYHLLQLKYIYLLGLTISFEAKKMLPGCPRGLMENVDLRPNNYIEK